MIEAKIRLSAKEMELVMNAGWILTKNQIIQKAKLMLEALQQQMTDHFSPGAPGSQSTPKISKGENYQGLPYLVLDYPRIFQKENTFAIRTLFWWGNFFSTTLHLGGSFKNQFAGRIISGMEDLKKDDYHLCVNEEEWEHHFETSNYVPVKDLTRLSFEQLVKEKSFIKIAKRIPLHQWNDVSGILLRNFQLMAALVVIPNFPDGGKAL